jgi:hypothetical protein
MDETKLHRVIPCECRMNKFYASFALMSRSPSLVEWPVASALPMERRVIASNPKLPQIDIEIPGEPLRHVQVPPTLQPVEPFLSYSKECSMAIPVVDVPSSEGALGAEQSSRSRRARAHSNRDRSCRSSPAAHRADLRDPEGADPKPSRRTLLDRLLD